MEEEKKIEDQSRTPLSNNRTSERIEKYWRRNNKEIVNNYYSIIIQFNY